MNENIDLTKILDGCPKGTEFYHTIYGTVCFYDIISNSEYPIRFKKDKYLINSVTKSGLMDSKYKGECTLFPSKDQRDWSKFERFWDKPKKERFNPKTLQPFDKVLVRDDDDYYWTADLFSHIANDFVGRVYCSAFRWKQCIPYNEETKHLVGTKEDCPEFYKWWEE